MSSDSFFFIAIGFFILICYFQKQTYKSLVKSKERKYTKELSDANARFNREKRAIERVAEEMQKESEKYVALHNEVMKCKKPFSRVAELFADWNTSIYDETAYYLKYKKHPAVKRAEDVRALKEKTKDAIRSYKEMHYKYLFLLDAFPELKQYVDDEEALEHLADYKDYEEFRTERDEVLDYVNQEEYRAMSTTERNQLALERFWKGKKSDWQVGMLYEMYVGYLLRKNNFSVIQYGIENGLQDLGRDIIASRTENGIRYIYIIQCKNWSKRRIVHENVVCQLYGTTVQYELMNKDLFSQETIIKPWLVITNELSDMAKKFADKLEVMVSVRRLDYFPLIKCNINNGVKIYHLPFDQQYYRTQIKLPGEFYAATVQEAEAAGFRRARKHILEK